MLVLLLGKFAEKSFIGVLAAYPVPSKDLPDHGILPGNFCMHETICPTPHADQKALDDVFRFISAVGTWSGKS